MRSRSDVVGNGTQRSLVVEVPRGISITARPFPEVVERVKRALFYPRLRPPVEWKYLDRSR